MTKARGPEQDRAPGSAVLLSRLAKQVYRRSNEELLGMHLRHLVALSYVNDHDGCPQQDLADAFCMDANNVVLLLNELEQLGYAARLRDPHDRRRHLVQITPAGRKALSLAERAQAAIEDEVLEALDPHERTTLRELLTRALRSIEPADGHTAGEAISDPASEDKTGDHPADIGAGETEAGLYVKTTASIST